MVRHLFLAAALTLAVAPLAAQDVVKGDATAGLVSKTAQGEVHVIADAALNDRRLVLKIVILNLSGTPQTFGPDAVTVTAGGGPVSLATRDALLSGQGGDGGTVETSQAHASQSLLTTSSGQTDVTGFTGGAGGAAGVPSSSIDRTRRPDPAAAAALDAVLLKPMTIRPNDADGGQVLTERLKRSKTPEVAVAIAFAGEVHHFVVKVPR